MRQSEYEVGGPPAIELAQDGGLYKVQWRRSAADSWHLLDESDRIIAPGDRLGFEMYERNRVMAVVAGERFVLAQLPADAHCCAWATTTVPTKPQGTPVDEAKVRRIALWLVETAVRAALLSKVTGPIPAEAQTFRLP